MSTLRLSKGLLCGWSVLIALLLLIVWCTPASAAPPMEGGVHVVQAGETLSSIAYRYGTTPAAIARANGLSNWNWIYVGQRLQIPGASGGQSGTGVSAGTVHVVSYGENLFSIAVKYGTTTQAIVNANGLSNPNFVYAGQRLIIPRAGGTTGATGGGGFIHVVQPGESLTSIAARYGLSTTALASANGLSNPNFVYAGQRLTIPGAGGGTNPPAGAAVAGRWIDVNLSTQSLVAYEGNTPVYWAHISSGLPGTPTVTGRYTIYAKYASTTMAGPGYYLPNVPWTMYFYRGYAIHGTYWHNNFGQPMSHGCINVSTPDAAWLYQFASVGTPVVIHY